ncbi:dihydrofolate reductase family protein [Paenarthrobacter sp. NCHU4564]|uniref:dihydrofolate reductase family protein n=1 Tax=Paenarthrobacter sp. NCHU4564 TaxID=3451353 RepID=UPI003F9A9FB0
MGLLTFSINVTLDGCVDHREGIADDETHAYYTRLLEENGAMLWGRTTYENDGGLLARGRTGRGGSAACARKLATELDRLDLIDEYKFLVHPVITGHGPTLFQGGLPSTRRLELISTSPLSNGVVSVHYRRAA